MRYRSYDEVEDLSTRDLFALLNIGDAQERVWASWALGLRLDSRLAPVLERLVKREPEAGTRRHQTLMLASFGTDVRFVAHGDPHDRVRGTALAFIARSAQPTDFDLYDFLMHSLHNETRAAQLAILENIRDDAPPFVVDALERLKDRAEDPVVRRAARLRFHPEPPPPRVRSPFQTTDYPLLVLPN